MYLVTVSRALVMSRNPTLQPQGPPSHPEPLELFIDHSTERALTALVAGHGYTIRDTETACFRPFTAFTVEVFFFDHFLLSWSLSISSTP